MMCVVPSAYLLPIKTAVIVFPLLALLLFVPAAVVTYRRHGVMTSWRTLSFYSFLFYSLTAFFMTVVPLPGPSVDVCAKYPKVAHPQLVPGNTFADIWKEAEGQVTLSALVIHNPAVLETLLNLLLLLPLGVYLRFHFRLNFLAAAAIGLGTSLFFEFTQLSGLWGVYECPYRLFDVDDLIANTGGAMIGWAIAGPLTRWLPTLDNIDDAALARRPVPLGRRFLALLIDLCALPFVMLFTTLLCVVVFDSSSWLLGMVLAVALWFVLLPWWLGGTPGKKLLLLKVVGPDGKRPELWRLVLRAAVLAIPLLPIPVITGMAVLATAAALFRAVGAGLDRLSEVPGLALDLISGDHVVVLLMAAAMFGLVCLLPVVFFIALWRNPEHHGPHERFSGVSNVALPHKRARIPQPASDTSTDTEVDTSADTSTDTDASTDADAGADSDKTTASER
ncbi:Glycopeptide antibiotics resistance protein [Saccharopolyspora shandongensis]|uniref:Glycopeptide antibiotics resistance protein n=1 Tax=Saccharopolyspora shandongensis TaxID=418495 RepID=A0A1H3PHW9_9PSEU|nr:Glycopeptide antibiotics resistance protein [Saccharopolyspora shandongensis]